MGWGLVKSNLVAVVVGVLPDSMSFVYPARLLWFGVAPLNICHILQLLLLLTGDPRLEVDGVHGIRNASVAEVEEDPVSCRGRSEMSNL